jgi:hypothetical protein
MRKPALILAAALVIGAALFAGAYLCARHFCVQRMAQSTDDLDWLRLEFHLGDADLAKIRQLHEGYRPICERNCRNIAAKKSELDQAVAAGTNSPAALDALRAEVAALRAECQAEMLAHFEDVSHAMPPEQGQRYLAEMKRITMGEHEAVEESMSGASEHGHQHTQ